MSVGEEGRTGFDEEGWALGLGPLLITFIGGCMPITVV
jgi:hypothetical protein